MAPMTEIDYWFEMCLAVTAGVIIGTIIGYHFFQSEAKANRKP
jgi:hypothetical protein